MQHFIFSLKEKEKSDLKKQTNPLLDKLNNTNYIELNMPRNLFITDPIYTMDATKNPVILQLRNQNYEIINTIKISDHPHLFNKNKHSSASHENNKIIYSNEPLLNNIIRSTMKLQPMSPTDYEKDLLELVILFK